MHFVLKLGLFCLLVWNRVRIFAIGSGLKLGRGNQSAYFGLKTGKGLKKRATHLHYKFQGVPPPPPPANKELAKRHKRIKTRESIHFYLPLTQPHRPKHDNFTDVINIEALLTFSQPPRTNLLKIGNVNEMNTINITINLSIMPDTELIVRF